MKCKEIMDRLEGRIPPAYAEEWDNVGLLAGSPDREVQKIYVSLDASDRAVEEAVRLRADMLVTHHPLLFSPVKRVTDEDFVGRRLIKLLQAGISYYAMHTNYDVAVMADAAAQRMGLQGAEALEVTCITDEGEGGFGRIGRLAEPVCLQDYAAQVKEIFGLPSVTVYGDPGKAVLRVAVCPGSGKSFLGTAVQSGADVYVTGDIDYHTGVDAVARGIAVIDAGHYGVEHIFIQDAAAILAGLVEPDVEIIKEEIVHPYFAV